MGRRWTELEPAARGFTEAQVAWGEAYVGMRDGEEEEGDKGPGCTLQPEHNSRPLEWDLKTSFGTSHDLTVSFFS